MDAPTLAQFLYTSTWAEVQTLSRCYRRHRRRHRITKGDSYNYMRVLHYIGIWHEPGTLSRSHRLAMLLSLRTELTPSFYFDKRHAYRLIDEFIGAHRHAMEVRLGAHALVNALRTPTTVFDMSPAVLQAILRDIMPPTLH